MNAPLFSRHSDPDNIRREIASLEAEINAARTKRDNVIRAISDRRLKKNRLEAQLAMCDSAPALSHPQLCPA